MRIPGQPVASVSWNPLRLRFHGAPSRSLRTTAAFTMIEIALCIAVVAIAMVAIIGVLPAGLNVQKQNREESLLTQDAELLLNVLRGGQTRLQDLLNYADRVTLVRQYRDRAPARTNHFHGPLVQGTPAGSDPLVDAFQVLGLISRPKYTQEASSVSRGNSVAVTNIVRLEMRSMSGSMADHPIIRKSERRTMPNDKRIDFAFRYLVTFETVTRQSVLVPGATQLPTDAMAGSVSEVRMILEWPLQRTGTDPNQYRLGFNRREFRTEVLGQPTRLRGNVPQDLSYFGSIVYPFNPVPETPGPNVIHFYRFLPGAL